MGIQYTVSSRQISKIYNDELVRQKYTKGVFWGLYNVLLLIMLHHGDSVHKPPGLGATNAILG